jgi:peptidoglycan-associated lipoprotein
MNATMKSMIACLLIAPIATGCATKGALRRAIEGEQQARMAADSAVMRQAQADAQSLRTDLDATRNELRTEVSSLRADLNALRSELQGMRTEFGAKISSVEEGMQFILPVHFDFNDSNLRTEAIPALNRFAQVVQRYYPAAKITVEGFADPAGSAAYNRELSMRRAESVRSFLTTNGLDAARLRAIGYGETRQVTPGAQRDELGAELNRRVVFVVEAKDANIVISSIGDGTR